MLILEVSDMTSQRRCFPYEKNIVINALYDTIEALGLYLDSSNSMRGTLIVSDTEHTGKMRIALGFDAGKDHTQVEIFPDDTGIDVTEIWGTVVLDELSGRMMHLHQLVSESSD
jgi:hypothetical protein